MTKNLRQNDIPTKLVRDKLPLPEAVHDFMFENKCKGKSIVLTYDYIPEIVTLVLEQILYIIIFACLLILLVLQVYIYKGDKLNILNELPNILKTNNQALDTDLIVLYNSSITDINDLIDNKQNNISIVSILVTLLVVCIFFTISFRIIPIMTQSCKGIVSLLIIRVINIGCLALFAKEVYKIIGTSTKFSLGMLLTLGWVSLISQTKENAEAKKK